MTLSIRSLRALTRLKRVQSCYAKFFAQLLTILKVWCNKKPNGFGTPPSVAALCEIRSFDVKKSLLVFCLIFLSFVTHGQTNITNNSITINGNVYYFKPSTVPSSPQPTISRGWIGDAEWYGEDAAKAWASISDWAIEHCIRVDAPVKPNNGQKIYITSVRAGRYNYVGHGSHHITIYYWVVGNNQQMEDGSVRTRTFHFSIK
jgi:hypothetical protein